MNDDLVDRLVEAVQGQGEEFAALVGNRLQSNLFLVFQYAWERDRQAVADFLGVVLIETLMIAGPWNWSKPLGTDEVTWSRQSIYISLYHGHHPGEQVARIEFVCNPMSKLVCDQTMYVPPSETLLTLRDTGAILAGDHEKCIALQRVMKEIDDFLVAQGWRLL